jgi:hypothetical protein
MTRRGSLAGFFLLMVLAGFLVRLLADVVRWWLG